MTGPKPLTTGYVPPRIFSPGNDPTEREDLCSDCPPVGWPTDKTRCHPCPRLADRYRHGERIETRRQKNAPWPQEGVTDE